MPDLMRDPNPPFKCILRVDVDRSQFLACHRSSRGDVLLDDPDAEVLAQYGKRDRRGHNAGLPKDRKGEITRPFVSFQFEALHRLLLEDVPWKLRLRSETDKIIVILFL